MIEPKGITSAFTFRPPGILKSSVVNDILPRPAPIPVFEEQAMDKLAQGIDPNNSDPLSLLKEIQPSILFFFELENAYFLVKEGYDGIILTSDFFLIEESISFLSEEKQELIKNFPSFDTVEHLEETFLSFDSNWMQYDHWMGYTLSKAYLANNYTPPHIQIAIPDYRSNSKGIIPFISSSLYEKSLKQAGLNQRATRLPDGIYQAKKLYFFWANSYLPQHYFNIKDSHNLFSEINKKISFKNNLPARFFIELDKELDTFVSDQEKEMLQQTLSELNITPINLKTMEWNDQIALFSQAELIISSHNPLLMNLMFCPNGTEFLELTFPIHNNNYLPAWPYLIASRHKLPYSFIDLSETKISPELLKDAVDQLDLTYVNTTY